MTPDPPTRADIVVRDARLDDADFIAACNRRLAAETERRVLDPGVIARGVRRGLASPDLARYFVAEVDGERAGTTMVTFEYSDWRDGVIWWLQSVYVLPAFRRRGVFRALHAHVRELARRRADVRALRLYVHHDNARAIATYRALGLRLSDYTVLEDDWSGAVAEADAADADERP